MATTKAVSVLRNDEILTAGAGDQTATAVNLTDGYGGTYDVKITNGGAAPDIAAQTQIQTSPDNSNWFDYGGPLVAGLTNSAVYSWLIDIPVGVQYVRSVAGSNTAQDVTIRESLSEVTAV